MQDRSLEQRIQKRPAQSGYLSREHLFDLMPA